MKKIVKIIFPFLLVALSLCSFGCKYASSYSATMCSRTSFGGSSSIKFGTLKGTQVFHMSCDDKKDELFYTGQLESGEIMVYYDNDDKKTLLFSIKGGENISNTLSNLKQGDLYIIIETNGECKKGEFHFDLKIA